MFDRLFTKGPSRYSEAPVSQLDIPRYPPFLKGLPAASPEQLQSTQGELIAKLRQVLGFNRCQFDKLIQPSIELLAAYVHLLPASEYHHHSGAGGLLRHSLEVAFWAAQAAEGIIFVVSGTPVEKKQLEPRWRVAAALGGLFHDIGKPVSDFSVTDEQGRYQWNPFLETLSEWASKNLIDRYFIRWRDGRAKRHEQFSILVLNRVMTPELLAWLTEPGPEILQAMLEAIGNTDPGHVLSRLVIEADQTSVQRDLKAQRISVDDNALGVPVERYLLDAMRRLLGSAQWLVNQREARVWLAKEHGQQALYLVWKSAANDIIELLAKDKIPGIPRDPDTLADILIERGLAVQTSDNARYWTLAPEVLSKDGKPIWLQMLKLRDADLLFSSALPAAITLHSQTGWEQARSAVDRGQAPECVNPVNPDPKPAEKPLPPEKPGSANPSERQHQAATKPAPTAVLDTRAPATSSHTDDKTTTLSAPDIDESETGEPDSDETVNTRLVLPKELAWLPSAKSVFYELDNHLLIRYPDAVRPWMQPKALLSQLSALDWLELDPAYPTRKSRTLGSEKGLLLRAEIAKGLKPLIQQQSEVEPVADSVTAVSVKKAAEAPGPAEQDKPGRSLKPIKPESETVSTTDVRQAQKERVASFVKELPTLLTNGNFPDVDHGADGICISVQSLRGIARDHGIMAGHLLRAIADSKDCQFDDGESVRFPSAK